MMRREGEAECARRVWDGTEVTPTTALQELLGSLFAGFGGSEVCLNGGQICEHLFLPQ